MSAYSSLELVAATGPVTISDPTLETAIRCVLSHWIAAGSRGGTRRRPPSNAGDLCRFLEEYVNTAAGDIAAPMPGFRSPVRPQWERVGIPRLGITATDIRSAWEEAVEDVPRHERLTASLPTHWLDAVVPTAFWPAVGCLIEDGPDVAERRIGRMLRNLRSRRVASSLKRDGQATMAHSTLEQYAAVARKLVLALFTLRDGHECLQGWTHTPGIRVPPGAVKQPMNLSTPPWHEIRTAYRRLHRDVTEYLGCEPGGEAAAILVASETVLAGLFRRLRNWAFFSLLVLTASREDALLRLTVGDVDRQFVSDLGVGPAVKLQPWKTWDDDEISAKPLGGAADPLHAYLTFLEVMLGDVPRDFPLFPGRLKHDATPWTASSVYEWLNGRHRSDGNPSRRALIPRHADNPFLGFGVHRFRAAPTQALDSLNAGDFIRRERIDVPQRFLADVLTDHKLAEMSAIYNDVATPAGRARVAGIAIRVLWALLTTPAGARHALDGDGYRSGLCELRALDAADAELDREIAVAANELAAGADSGALIAQILGASARKATLARNAERVESRLRDIRDRDPVRAFVPIPDDAPSGALIVDLEAIEREVAGEDDGLTQSKRPRVRDWLTPKEFGLVCRRSTKQIGKWIASTGGEDMPRADEDRPWEPGLAPVETASAKRRRIIVDGLNPAFVEADPHRAQQIQELLTDWPSEWASEYRRACANRPAHMRQPPGIAPRT